MGETPVRTVTRVPEPLNGRADEASSKDPPRRGLTEKNWGRTRDNTVVRSISDVCLNDEGHALSPPFFDGTDRQAY